MSSTTLKIFGICVLGAGLGLAVSIHSSEPGTKAETEAKSEGSGRLHRVDRLQNHTSIHQGTVPQKRSLYSRQTDNSMASRLRSRNDSRIVVGGDVQKPGSVQILQGMTLWTAIQTAGGATEFGSLRRVRLDRMGIEKHYDLTKQEFQEAIVEAGDCIVVPRKRFL